MELFGDGDKIAQMAQLDIHIFKVSFEIINILDRIFTFSYPNLVVIPVTRNHGEV
ncbi:hypothetical protein FJMB80055_22410 [Enterobacter hormaechei]|nr:hypothetical protein FJMB80003_18880 [Enterobacter hormaechei]GJK10426.1 hypothetical protein TUM16657_30200 [Enterobacter cloacae]BDK20755.1 hypothetical protein FJMB80379_25010 [Enterobacter hormaechei]GKW61348.1 hypothetical protein FJMB80055_22410 [Enterobacter hormaechei]GKW79448.1 hypothetical protein FJMB80015_17170 [Enterobacter hormaechei]